jgi:hypothetical protein
MGHYDILRQAILTARIFQTRKLWERFSNFDCFGIRFPERKESFLAVVMGAGEQEYGLTLMRGPAAAELLQPSETDAIGDDTNAEIDMFGYGMFVFGDLSEQAKEIIRKAKFYPRSDELIPHFLAKRPYCLGRLPDEKELQTLIWTMRGLMEANDRGELFSTEIIDPEGICTLLLAGKPDAVQVTVTRDRWEMPDRPDTIRLPAKLPNLRGLPRLSETWLVGLPTTPGAIAGDDRALRILLVVEEAVGLPFVAHPFQGEDLQEAIDQLIATFRKGGMRGIKGLPRLILFSSRSLYEAMRPILASVGVACRYEVDLPKLQEAVKGFCELMGGGIPDVDLDEDEIFDELPIPAADDLKGWKEADRLVNARWAQIAREDVRFWDERSVFRYFDEEELGDWGDALRDGTDPSYIVWRILDYRATVRSKTIAEKELNTSYPPAMNTLLQAHRDSYPSLYRVVSHNVRAGTVRLEDILLGGGVTIHDQAMSENIDDGWIVAARVYPAGNFSFLLPGGPVMDSMSGSRAVEFLEDQRVEFTPEGLKRDAHVFGWLYVWMCEELSQRRITNLVNMDGHPMLWHTAFFSVTDPVRVRRALEARKDIEYDSEIDEYLWVARSGKAVQKMHGPVDLGRLEFVGDELILTTNSENRFKAGRKWLEKIQGVTFLAVKTREWDDLDVPGDERMPRPDPGPMPPEVKGEIQKMMDRHYMSWLDTPLPILGGMTPRQRCNTEQGRQEVARQIRSMPEPMGTEDVSVPRKAMLRELGMAKEADAIEIREIPAEDPYDRLEPLVASPKTGRNEPCPCGSGRKYKKCCGRNES